MKKVLVIIPFHNVEDYLEGAIESILQQTYQNFHLVLIDDASTDGSVNIAENYKDNSKVSLLYNPTNKGCYYSVNKALEYFKDKDWDYWHFHGADDMSDLTRLEKIILYLTENPNVIGCKTTFIRVHSNTGEMDILNGEPHIGTSEGIAFYSREAFIQLGYYDNTRFSGDTDYFWRLGAWINKNNLQYKLGEHKEVLYIAYLHDNNLTKKYNWEFDRPNYWNKSQQDIKQMIQNNNFYREIFE